MVPKGSAHHLSFDVVSNERVADGIYKLVIHAQGIASGLEPGQFVNLAVPGDPAQILRIPLSFSRVDEAADTQARLYAWGFNTRGGWSDPTTAMTLPLVPEIDLGRNARSWICRRGCGPTCRRYQFAHVRRLGFRLCGNRQS